MKTHNHAGAVGIDVKVENFYCIRQNRPPTTPPSEYIMVRGQREFFDNSHSLAL